MTSADQLMKKIGNVAIAAGALLAGTSIAHSHPLARLVESAKASATAASSSSASKLPPPLTALRFSSLGAKEHWWSLVLTTISSSAKGIT